ncbi:DUF3829 domain-containing protein [Orbus wheelerorum]|uniref:DUF3829 domain-containing protein n=1 Tax=Orbus wheelerorum TaxID=3074111 RepID=UPI00370DD0C1
MKKRQTIITGLLTSCILAISILSGCEKNVKSDDIQNAESTNQNLNQKLNVYTECYNLTKNLDDAIERYEYWVKDMQQGPTGNERSIGGLYFSGDLKKTYACKDDIDKLAAIAPITDLDNAATEFANNFVAASKIANELSIYYSQKDYKDDGFKKGKALHKTLVSAAILYNKSANVLSDKISVANDLRQLDRLIKVEKEEGRGDTYYRLSIMTQSKQLIRLLVQDDFSINEVKELLDKYSQIINEAVNYYESPNYKTISTWRFFIDAAQRFNNSAKERFRSIRDNKVLRTDKITEGSLANLQERYNTIVHFFNH